ncbi:MAG TPA: SAF domain-containing protein [Solirubrobacterales bacterium]|nr:SAF domain-containing protein [Solirubrobacterales bacterium]
MSRRGRALAFAALAVACGLASAGIASTYRERVDEQLGEVRTVVTVTRPLPVGSELRGRLAERSLAIREVPDRFLPPDAIADPRVVAGRRLAAAVPAGSYLLGSHLRSGAGPRERAPRIGGDRQPVEVTVSGAGALAATGPERAEVDVVVAGEPVTGGTARVRVAARSVRLLAIAPADPAAATTTGGDSWSATLALTRREALELIEAENFAREIRLIPSS